MSKRAICLFMTAMLVALMLVLTVLRVSAESGAELSDKIQLNTSSTVNNTVSSQSTTSKAAFTTEPTEASTEKVIPADFPALTVNAISNFFPSASAEYSVTKKEVTVTYWLKSSKELMSVQWYLAYDPEVFSISEEKNNLDTVCPVIGDNAALDFGEDVIKFSSSNVNLYDFSMEEMPFATIIFDVKELDPEEPITTKIDLTVDVFCTADKDNETDVYNPETETMLVVNSGINQVGMDSVRLSRNTTLTQSNFVQATTAEPETTELQTDASENIISASDDEPTEETTYSVDAITSTDITSVTAAITENKTAPVTHNENKRQYEDRGVIDTGSAGYAFVCLGVVVAATSILFIMRKKEILYN